MSEPRRLMEDGGNELELALLRSARDDAPSPRSRRRALLALGLGGAVGASATVTTAAATAATATATTAAAGGAATTAATASGLALVKWVGIGIVGGLLTVGTIEVAQPSQPRPAPAAMAQARQAEVGAAQAANGQAQGLAAQPAEEAQKAEAAPVEAEPKREAKASPRPAAKDEPSTPSLADEVAGLDKAREALASGDPARALGELERHDRKFAGGALSPEAMVLRIEATAARGDKAAAIRLGNEFLAQNPRSPHAARVRSVIAQSSTP